MDEKYILLVEDNHDDVALTRMAFKKCRLAYKIEVASNGEEALDFLFSRGKYIDRDHGQDPALILLDLKMPCINGLEILQQIRANERTSSIPVVVLTSSIEDTDREKSYRLGANRFYIKPVDFTEFQELVKKLCSEWLES